VDFWGSNGRLLITSGGATYVAYLFASDAGGFGDDGDESIIKCGSYVGNSEASNQVNLGFEPQWVLVKPSQILAIGGLWLIPCVAQAMTKLSYF
jgi:hypothetical protein